MEPNGWTDNWSGVCVIYLSELNRIEVKWIEVKWIELIRVKLMKMMMMKMDVNVKWLLLILSHIVSRPEVQVYSNLFQPDLTWPDVT